jgi:hypothetical protein
MTFDVERYTVQAVRLIGISNRTADNLHALSANNLALKSER